MNITKANIRSQKLIGITLIINIPPNIIKINPIILKGPRLHLCGGLICQGFPPLIKPPPLATNFTTYYSDIYIIVTKLYFPYKEDQSLDITIIHSPDSILISPLSLTILLLIP